MDGAYWVAWITLYVFGIGLIGLCVYALRRHFYIAFFVALMGAYWMLVPMPFDGTNSAPLFISLTFQLFIDPEASFAFSATAALIGTSTIIAATLLLYGFNSAYRRAVRVSRNHADARRHREQSEASRVSE